MKGNSLRLIMGIAVVILLVVAGFYYYMAIYRGSPYNTAETSIPDVEAPPQSSGGGGSGSLRP